MSDTEIDKQLRGLLEKLVEQSTLSLDATKRVEDLKTELRELRASYSNIESNYVKLQAENGVLSKTIGELKNTIKELENTNHILSDYKSGLDKRFFDLSVGEKTIQLERQRTNDIFQLVSLIFKNPVVKETVCKSTSIPVACPNGGYVTTHNNVENTTTTKETE